MQLKNQVEWALHCCAILAGLGPDRHLPTRDLAELHGVPKEYLSKALQALSQAGIVDGTLGPSGGYRLARGSAETRVSEIILAVDEPIKATRCTEMGATGCLADRSKCLTHDLWEELGNQIHMFLASVTLADVLERKIAPRLAEAPPTAANNDSMAAAS